MFYSHLHTKSPVSSPALKVEDVPSPFCSNLSLFSLSLPSKVLLFHFPRFGRYLFNSSLKSFRSRCMNDLSSRLIDYDRIIMIIFKLFMQIFEWSYLFRLKNLNGKLILTKKFENNDHTRIYSWNSEVFDRVKRFFYSLYTITNFRYFDAFFLIVALKISAKQINSIFVLVALYTLSIWRRLIINFTVNTTIMTLQTSVKF